MRRLIGCVALALAIAGCNQPTPGVTPAPTPPPPRPTPAPVATTGTAIRGILPLRDGDDSRRSPDSASGPRTFTDTYGGLIVAGAVEGVGIGAHGIHIHEIGKCDAPFTTAGGHFNPEKKHHGFRSSDGPHLGDLPNIDVPAVGQAPVRVPDAERHAARRQPAARRGRRIDRRPQRRVTISSRTPPATPDRASPAA